MYPYIQFDEVTGQIVSYGSTNKSSFDNDPNPVMYVDSLDLDFENLYVLNGVLTERPMNTAKLINQTLVDLPTPCEIKINGTIYQCTDTNAMLNFNLPNTYKIQVSSFPCLDANFEITI